MDYLSIILVVLAGAFAGFVNVLAASGSLLTLPLLIFLGLPPNVANGTNRIAILGQNLVATLSFRKQKVLEPKLGYKAALPALVGSIVGASIAVEIPDAIMQNVIGGLLVFMFVLLLYKPSRWLRDREEQGELRLGAGQVIVLFFIGVYGGFIQASVGLFLLVGLVLNAGFDLARANALKVFIVLLFTPLALAVFMMNGQVDYAWGGVLAVGQMSGAYLGSKVAVRWRPKYIHHILLAIIFLSALQMFGVFGMLFGN